MEKGKIFDVEEIAKGLCFFYVGIGGFLCNSMLVAFQLLNASIEQNSYEFETQ